TGDRRRSAGSHLHARVPVPGTGRRTEDRGVTMATETVPTHPALPLTAAPATSLAGGLWQSLRYALIVAAVMGGIAVLLEVVIAPLLQSVQVDEQFTSALASLLVGLLPAAVYIA